MKNNLRSLEQELHKYQKKLGVRYVDTQGKVLMDIRGTEENINNREFLSKRRLDTENDIEVLKRIGDPGERGTIKYALAKQYDKAITQRNKLADSAQNASKKVIELQNNGVEARIKNFTLEGKSEDEIKGFRQTQAEHAYYLRRAKREENDLKQNHGMMRGMMSGIASSSNPAAIEVIRKDFAEVCKAKDDLRIALNIAENAVKEKAERTSVAALVDLVGIDGAKVNQTGNEKIAAKNLDEDIQKNKADIEKNKADLIGNPTDDVLNKKNVELNRQYVALSRLKAAQENHADLSKMMADSMKPAAPGQPNPPILDSISNLKKDKDNLISAQKERELSLKAIEESAQLREDINSNKQIDPVLKKIQLEQIERKIKDQKEAFEFTNSQINSTPKNSLGVAILNIETKNYSSLLYDRAMRRDKFHAAEESVYRAKAETPINSSRINTFESRLKDYRKDYDNINAIITNATNNPKDIMTGDLNNRLLIAQEAVASLRLAQMTRDAVRDKGDEILSGPAMDNQNVKRKQLAAIEDHNLYNALIDNSIKPPKSPMMLESNFEALRQSSWWERRSGNLGVLDMRDALRKDLKTKENAYYKSGSESDKAAYLTALSDYQTAQGMIETATKDNRDGKLMNMAGIKQDMQDLQEMRKERDDTLKKRNKADERYSDAMVTLYTNKDPAKEPILRQKVQNLLREKEDLEAHYKAQDDLLKRIKLPEGMEALKGRIQDINEAFKSREESREFLNKQEVKINKKEIEPNRRVIEENKREMQECKMEIERRKMEMEKSKVEATGSSNENIKNAQEKLDKAAKRLVTAAKKIKEAEKKIKNAEDSKLAALTTYKNTQVNFDAVVNSSIQEGPNTKSEAEVKGRLEGAAIKSKETVVAKAEAPQAPQPTALEVQIAALERAAVVTPAATTAAPVVSAETPPAPPAPAPDSKAVVDTPAASAPAAPSAEELKKREEDLKTSVAPKFENTYEALVEFNKKSSEEKLAKEEGPVAGEPAPDSKRVADAPPPPPPPPPPPINEVAKAEADVPPPPPVAVAPAAADAVPPPPPPPIAEDLTLAGVEPADRAPEPASVAPNVAKQEAPKAVAEAIAPVAPATSETDAGKKEKEAEVNPEAPKKAEDENKKNASDMVSWALAQGNAKQYEKGTMGSVTAVAASPGVKNLGPVDPTAVKAMIDDTYADQSKASADAVAVTVAPAAAAPEAPPPPPPAAAAPAAVDAVPPPPPPVNEGAKAEADVPPPPPAADEVAAIDAVPPPPPPPPDEGIPPPPLEVPPPPPPPEAEIAAVAAPVEVPKVPHFQPVAFEPMPVAATMVAPPPLLMMPNVGVKVAHDPNQSIAEQLIAQENNLGALQKNGKEVADSPQHTGGPAPALTTELDMEKKKAEAEIQRARVEEEQRIQSKTQLDAANQQKAEQDRQKIAHLGL